MKRALKKNSGLYHYLDSTKVLESGDEQIIALARKTYWLNYRASWRREKRKKDKKFTVEYTPSEAKKIQEFAKKLKRSRTAYIKEASLAYMRQQFIVPDILIVAEIRALLTMNLSLIRQLVDGDALQYTPGAFLIDKLLELENKILAQLQYPITAEKWIADTIKQSPETKDSILKMLKTEQIGH
jgi:hypothetical protein